MLFSRDTSPDARQVLIEILRKKTPAEKLAMVDGARALARELTMTGLRMRNPDASPLELEVLYLEHMLSPELARRVLASAQGAETPAPAPDRDAQRRG